MEKTDTICLAHGGGGELTRKLIDDEILTRFASPLLNSLPDAAVWKTDNRPLAFTTDSYVVQPLFFPGGDIGKLAVCGTVNDLAMTGAKPKLLSLALIIEEGFPLTNLRRILDSIHRAAQTANVQIATGDTKVVQRGSVDGLFINTAGIGHVHPDAHLGFDRIEPGDVVLINGNLGDHGLTVMAQREGLAFQAALESDATPLADLAEKLLNSLKDRLKFMRDPTRGGLAATLVEIAQSSSLGLEINESALPVSPPAQAAADMLGLDVLNVANEGKLVAVVAPDAAQDALDCMKIHEYGKNAAPIGHTKNDELHLVELLTPIGGRRLIQMPYGEDLPRIC